MGSCKAMLAETLMNKNPSKRHLNAAKHSLECFLFWVRWPIFKRTTVGLVMMGETLFAEFGRMDKTSFQ